VPLSRRDAIGVANGMRTLVADGIRKAVEGQTTIDEVRRVAAVSW
jgi:type II secretory ATPase GspE/PulE/Tfp pilus assembly ATPase PilB-like protein